MAKISQKIALVLLVSSLVLGACTRQTTQSASRTGNSHRDNSDIEKEIVAAHIGDSPQLKLELAQTPIKIIQGLSGREQLGADGMLFVFKQPVRPQFWMKDMEFDLDLVWIKNLRVVEVTPQIPAPTVGVTPDRLPTYSSNQPVDMVLELKAGQAARWSVVVGAVLNIIDL